MDKKPAKFEPLRPVLKHVEEELSNHMAEACRRSDIRSESTGELERLSDTLYEAAREARAAAAIRRRMHISQIQNQLQERLTLGDSANMSADEPPPAA